MTFAEGLQIGLGIGFILGITLRSSWLARMIHVR